MTRRQKLVATLRVLSLDRVINFQILVLPLTSYVATSPPQEAKVITMSRQIEQALLSLMPTYGSDLPPSLVELAGSLLAQSRHRASALKTEEEIARLYACANIACDRYVIPMIV